MEKSVICLGIESTAHTFSVGIVSGKGEILSEARDMFTSEKSGMIPNEVARHHKVVAERIINQALIDAKITWNDVAFISFSQGPGLAPCLIQGMEIAKELAVKYNKELIGVNHICAHLEIGKLLTDLKYPIFVFVSGANTQIIAYEGKKYRVFGETLDIALGNALDKFGRESGLGFPAGPKIEQLSKQGKYVEIPYVVKGMDVSFSGIVTKAINMVKQNKVKMEDMCYSLQETCFAMLTEVAERALAYCEKNEVLLIGGVATNKRFCEMLDTMCKDRGAKFGAPPLKYAGDQGAMIAWLGLLQYQAGEKYNIEDIDINPRWRVDEVEVTWI